MLAPWQRKPDDPNWPARAGLFLPSPRRSDRTMVRPAIDRFSLRRSVFRPLFSRSPVPASSLPGRRAAAARVVSAQPPQEFAPRDWSSRLGDWLSASGWRVAGVEIPSAFGQRARSAALAAARLDFADALWDVRTVAAGTALDRVAVTRSLHELWHLRGEVFAHVALLHDQAEAERRLAVLDRHFEQRGGPSRRRARGGSAADR